MARSGGGLQTKRELLALMEALRRIPQTEEF
jgi:hypothetical protein